MPSEATNFPTQPEKAHHYTYLKEFRTQQCPLFLQHKCTQHRPYTCFHWHFLNQRRRRPIRRRDGTFNYSADVYCQKYDETTGICEDGDDCPYLHRTAGDTERRYHLRYYKTGNCVHETDAKSHCVKNGPHCAFAHGIGDLRQPVYDIRELQNVNGCLDKGPLGALDGSASTQLEKDRLVNEDPKWNDTNYVLANYKTESCKRPPRLCRQGYACPSYHNTRDRRRSPKEFKYRSTPCPNVKHGDEWEDPTQCENGDQCAYCHTRTEQQFHPEIYKSTKCKDMVQSGYCPRGPFCAFAHVEQEMTTQRELSSSLNENPLAAFLQNALPVSSKSDNHLEGKDDRSKDDGELFTNGNSFDNNNSSFPEPIGKERSGSFSSHHSKTIENQSNRMKAPGSEREDNVKLRQQLASIDDDPSLDTTEKMHRRQNILLSHPLAISNSSILPGLGNGTAHNLTIPIPPPSTSNPNTSNTAASTMSPNATAFYPPGDTVESVIGNALDDEFGELSLASIDREFRENDNDANSVSSGSFSGYNQNYFGPASLPVTIPTSISRAPLGSFSSQSPPVNSPLGSLPTSMVAQQHKLQGAAAAFLQHPNPGKFSAPGFADFNTSSSQTNSNNNGISQSPLLASSFGSTGGGLSNGIGNGLNNSTEMMRLREELSANKAKMMQWEEGISQARNACEAWKKEAELAARKAQVAEDERTQILKQREEALNQVVKLKTELDQLKGGPFLRCLQRSSDLETLPANMIQTIQSQLRQDLETVDKVLLQQASLKCLACQEMGRSMTAMPCNHTVLCESCAPKHKTCPFCQSQISHMNNRIRPL